MGHMFWWNVLGMLVLVGPAVATWGFFKTLNEIEIKLNENKLDKQNQEFF